MKQKFLLCVAALMFGVHVLGINLVLVKSIGKKRTRVAKYFSHWQVGLSGRQPTVD